MEYQPKLSENYMPLLHFISIFEVILIKIYKIYS